MEMIYICPFCHKEYTLESGPVHLCDYCKIHLVNTELNEAEWLTTPPNIQNSILKRIDQAGALGLDTVTMLEQWENILKADSERREKASRIENGIQSFFSPIFLVSFILMIPFLLGGLIEKKETAGMIGVFLTVCFFVSFIAINTVQKGTLRPKQDERICAANTNKRKDAEVRYQSQIEQLGISDSIDIWQQRVALADNSLYITMSPLGYRWNSVNKKESIKDWTLEYTEIPKQNVYYFAKKGDLQYYERVVGGGGYKFSLGGAIIGGLLAGDAGIFLGGIKEEPIKTKTEKHDDRMSLICYKDKDKTQIIEFKGHEVYEFLSKKLPEKRLSLLNPY